MLHKIKAGPMKSGFCFRGLFMKKLTTLFAAFLLASALCAGQSTATMGLVPVLYGDAELGIGLEGGLGWESPIGGEETFAGVSLLLHAEKTFRSLDGGIADFTRAGVTVPFTVGLRIPCGRVELLPQAGGFVHAGLADPDYQTFGYFYFGYQGGLEADFSRYRLGLIYAGTPNSWLRNQADLKRLSIRVTLPF